MSASWSINPDDLIAALEEQGFDVEQSDLQGGSLSARKERGTRAFLLKTDAGGRIQFAVTEQLADTTDEPIDVHGVHLTVTDSTIRRRTMRGIVTDIGQFRAVIAMVARINERDEPPPV